MPSAAAEGCNVVRLTQREDMTIKSGVDFATSAVEQALPEMLVVICIALPCTGGSPSQNINKFLPGGKERLQAHWNY